VGDERERGEIVKCLPGLQYAVDQMDEFSHAGGNLGSDTVLNCNPLQRDIGIEGLAGFEDAVD
jgi:hypothetical protein